MTEQIEVLDYIVEITRELAALARMSQLQTERHLFEMAHLQAATQFEALTGRPHARSPLGFEWIVKAHKVASG